MNLFLTGTDTDVGKTYVAALLIRSLRRAGLDSVGFKPICCGSRDDAETLHAASGEKVALNEINPVWLRTPAAPYTAGMIENRSIDLALIRDTFSRLRGTHGSVIVEGVGGWRVPIARDYFVSDLAKEMALPVAVVIANRLGAINHALLTIEAIRAAGLECAGIILNHPASTPPDDSIATTTNRAIIEELAGVPVLFDIAHGQRELELALG
ncbi:MAG TPA: dethiobiotin synthase [Chthoniobacteraceae bacterium]|jgi:dethiobiotin synthetase